MSSCTDGMCGTGGVGLPKPGDPSNDGILSATPAFGGIDLNWTMPSSNPFAVAHTKVYRGLTSDPLSSMPIATVGGSFFFDRTEANVTYYYWIRSVSVQGTEGELIGPASAAAKPQIDEYIELLTGRIDAGVLAQSLRERIASITLLEGGLLQEVQDRFGADSALAQSIETLQLDVDGALTVVAEEIIRRQDGDSALVDSMSIIGAKADQNAAAIIEEATVRASNDTALANRVTTVESAVGDGYAAVEQRMETKINAVDGKVTSLGSLYTIKLTANGLAGGFGVYNDGSTVQAGFDVDNFWIGRTQANKRKPFIIENDVVYMDEAVINKLTFNKLRAADGSFIVDGNGRIKASYIDTTGITVTASTVDTWSQTPSGTVRITNKGMAIYDGNGVLRGFFGDDS